MQLNKKWNFHPNRVSISDLGSSKITWDLIEVPGEWSMQGFSVKKKHFATYFTTFTVPASWVNHKIFLRFEGVYSHAKIGINNRNVGEHIGGFTCFDLDITNTAKIGPGQENTLAVWVKNESLSDQLSSGSSYACHPLGGITRKVVLFAVPHIHITDFIVTTDLKEFTGNGLLHVSGSVENASNIGFRLRLK